MLQWHYKEKSSLEWTPMSKDEKMGILCRGIWRRVGTQPFGLDPLSPLSLTELIILFETSWGSHLLSQQS